VYFWGVHSTVVLGIRHHLSIDDRADHVLGRLFCQRRVRRGDEAFLERGLGIDADFPIAFFATGLVKRGFRVVRFEYRTRRVNGLPAVRCSRIGSPYRANIIADRREAGVRRTGYRRHVVGRMLHRGKWEQIGDFGPLILSLEEAAEYGAKDPMSCFCH